MQTARGLPPSAGHRTASTTHLSTKQTEPDVRQVEEVREEGKLLCSVFGGSSLEENSGWMNTQFVVVLLFAFYNVATAFECSPDTILRMATDKRLKQVERECHLEKTKEQPCDTRNDLENAWKEFMNVTNQYRKAVTKCREQAATPSAGLYKNRPKRHTVYRKQEGISEKVRPESEQFDRTHLTRARRQTCRTNSSKELEQMKENFLEHCERDNICLPDEDISSEQERNRFKQLHASRAKRYSAYLTQLSLCYGRLS